MSKKLWLSIVGLSLAAMNYGMIRLTSYEPKITRYNIVDDRWHGRGSLKIAMVSDFHGGSGQWSGQALQRIVRCELPDMILVVGDHFDYQYDANNSLDFFRHMSTKIPTFFVTGNNEEILASRNQLMEDMRRMGVHTLDHSGERIYIRGQAVDILGLSDMARYRHEEEWIWAAQQNLREKADDDNAFHVVLCHRPDPVHLFEQLDGHLICCGHTHGGQWRLPLLGPIFSPNQHVLPKYSYGLYRMGKKHFYHMVVGAGFDVHPIVPRIANPPELVVIEVHGKS